MRRIGPIFNEDHRPNLRFRPKYYKKLVFVKKNIVFYTKKLRSTTYGGY